MIQSTATLLNEAVSFKSPQKMNWRCKILRGQDLFPTNIFTAGSSIGVRALKLRVSEIVKARILTVILRVTVTC